MIITNSIRTHALIVFVATCVTILLEILLPKLIGLRIPGFNLFQILPFYYIGLSLGAIATYFIRPKSPVSFSVFACCLGVSVLVAAIGIVFFTSETHVQIASVIPFAVTGALLGSAFREHDQNIIYFADLSGFAFGTGIIALFLPLVGAETLILLSILLPLTIGLWTWTNKKLRYVTTGLSLGLLIFVLSTAIVKVPEPLAWDFFKLNNKVTDNNSGKHNFWNLYKKQEGEYFGSIIATQWDFVSRTDLVKANQSIGTMVFPPEKLHSFGATNPLYEAPYTYELYYNGFYSNSVRAAGYLKEHFGFATPDAKALIIGLGGGTDVHFLKANGITDITGAEIKQATIALMTSPQGQWASGGTYDHVDYQLADGRTFVRHTEHLFDLIHISFAELYFPFPYSRIYVESYLYTVEAFQSYWQRLSDDGTLYVSKFGSFSGHGNNEVYKLILTAMQALYDKGIEYPERHLQIIGMDTDFEYLENSEITLVYIAKQAISEERYTNDIQPTIQAPYVNVYSPLATSQSEQESYFLGQEIQLFAEALRSSTTAEYFASRDPGLRPATDERPFFYTFDKFRSFGEQNLRLVSGLTLGLILIPCLILIRLQTRAFGARTMTNLGALALLGVSFGLLQVSLMQQFHIFLGNPAYSLLAIFCVYPALSGLGSLITRNSSLNSVLIGLATLVISAFTIQLAIAPFLETLRIDSIPLRVVIVSIVIAPLAIASGVFFPWLLKRVPESNQSIQPLLFAWNMAFVLLGVTYSVNASSIWGISPVYQIAVLGYLGLLPFIYFLRTKPA